MCWRSTASIGPRWTRPAICSSRSARGRSASIGRWRTRSTATGGAPSAPTTCSSAANRRPSRWATTIASGRWSSTRSSPTRRTSAAAATTQVRAIAVDANGNIYLTGVTPSTNFPTASAHQGSKLGTNATTDAFVTKLNPAGTTVFFSTYLGGTGSENNATETAGSIALDANGNVYVAGDTVSADFPTTGNAFQPTYAGGSNNPADGFIARFTATGVLSYSTYFGGQDVDHINGLAIASDGDITFSGRTRSSQVEGFPLVNAIDTTLAGTADAFVARLESNGASLVFSTFIGGTGDEFSFYRSGHAIDAQGNVYVSGITSSVDYPTTAGAFRTVRTNATNDGFVTKLSANGQTILASTWFGGSNGENLVSDVALAPTGEVVIGGETNTTAGFPLVNANQTTFQGGIRDGFVAKLNATLTSAIFSTYFGGNERDVVRDVAVDAAGTIHIVGTTGSTTLPLVQPVQPTLASANDAFIARFGPTGALTFSSFLGSTQVNEEGMAVAATATGQTVAGGWTAGNNFPRGEPVSEPVPGRLHRRLGGAPRSRRGSRRDQEREPRHRGARVADHLHDQRLQLRT